MRLLTKKEYKARGMFLLQFRAAPVHSSVLLLNTLLTALLPSFSMLLTAAFINTALQIVEKQAELSAVFWPLAGIVASIVYQRLSGTVVEIVNVSLENRNRRIIKAELVDLRASMEYRHVENQDDQDLINRVNMADTKIYQMFSSLMGIGNIIVQIAGILVILLVHVWWAVVFLIVFCVPLFYIGIKAGRENYEADREMTKLDRRANYISDVLKNRDSIEERYIFGYTDQLNEKFHQFYETARLFRKKVEKRNFIKMKGGSLMISLCTLIMGAVLIYPTANGQLSIGLFVSLIPSLANLVQMVSWNLNYNLLLITSSREFLRDLTKFMKLSDVPGVLSVPASPPVTFESLEFINVGFRYPGTDKYILKDMSFRMERGRHYALVGINGAGKTTITKLITGLYDDFEGEILINGKSIRQYTQAELKSFCSVVYQDFARYYISVFDNIALGDVVGLQAGSTPDSPVRERVHNAVELLDLDDVIDKLPDKYNTMLGKVHEDGLDLSGGEWQRIALARAVVSPASLLILDEPTAALDPISECNVYREFEKICGTDRTTIFISHRLGSTKLANEILVVDDGRIAERGTHDELMAQDGLYADMYRSQADWYVQDRMEVGCR